MKYISVCSGIEAATVAWQPLGFKALWYSEVDKYCNKLLQHYYPETPNLGDMTKVVNNEIYNKYRGIADILVGGTPCQSFSVAGNRNGLDDKRGNLALWYVRILRDYKPKWFVWENVLGVLSSKNGADFATFLTALSESGYGLAWRVLNARYFGQAQNRKRVFVVGYYGDWRPSIAVLFEPRGTSSDDQERGKERKKDPVVVARALPAHRGRYDISTDTHLLYNAGSQGYRINSSNGCAITQSTSDGGFGSRSGIYKFENQVRILTPLERERVQGFPDGYTNVCGLSETQRAKQIGNSMPVKVMEWIGTRIKQVNEVMSNV